jgi:hypothetical protein
VAAREDDIREDSNADLILRSKVVGRGRNSSSSLISRESESNRGVDLWIGCLT